MLRIFRHYLSWQVLGLAIADLIILIVAGYIGQLAPLFGLPPLWMGFGPIFLKVLALAGFGWGVLSDGELNSPTEERFMQQRARVPRTDSTGAELLNEVSPRQNPYYHR